MKLGDIIRFNKEKCFNGAVQTEWFYDEIKVMDVASSYVFHGPKYFGVSKSDVDLEGHKLIDTASFALDLTNKLYEIKPNNCFVTAIAGYGTGKSHLAVSLAALFSGGKKLSQVVTKDIEQADLAIGQEIRKKNTKKNLVIAINGMNNFNLDSEVLRCVRIALKQNNLSDDILKKLTKSYDIAKHFVGRVYDTYCSQFENEAKKVNIDLGGASLKQYLLDHVESDPLVLSLINNIYREINGDSIQWDRGLSAGDILSTLSNELCGEGKTFNKIIILFDEFGRYIEYAASNPAIAGEAALQQIFEAVQNASGGIIFVGFIQNELDAYLSRIEKSSNIMRYVGRYKNSENFFLSSNFETILANLIQKKDPSKFSLILETAFNQHEQYFKRMQRSLSRWDRSAIKKNVWSDWDMYSSVILKGCYPLHPITVWMLSNINSWLQQRSSITFASELVEEISDRDIDNTNIPYVYPINIIDSSLFDELLNAEEKGLVMSQYCMLYRDIKVKIGDKLSENEGKVLKAILVINVARFSFYDKEDAILGIKYCCNLSNDAINKALISLENMHGVITFDENAKTYDLIAEANGYNEFKRIFARYRTSVGDASIDDCDENLLSKLGFNSYVETSFAQTHNICSSEWKYNRILMDSSDINQPFLEGELARIERNFDGESPRGELIFAYCSKNSEKEITRLSQICKIINLDHEPLIIIFLDDRDNTILNALTVKVVLDKFSIADNERFQKHISFQRKENDKKICEAFNEIVSERSIVTSEGLDKYSGRLSALCTQRFEEIYTDVPPFMFDGFENKNSSAARRYLSNICIKLFNKTLLNSQNYHALSRDEKNRVTATLLVGISTSWQVYTNEGILEKPLNSKLRSIFDRLDEEIKDDKPINTYRLESVFCRRPYGMNLNSFTLFLFYFISYQDKHLLSFYNGQRLLNLHLTEKVFKGLKLNQDELSKISLQRNLNFDKDVIQDLCKEILDCSLVEKCVPYKNKLEELIEQEGVSEENQLIVASAQMRINKAENLRDTIYGNLKKGEDLLNEEKKDFIVPKFMKIFQYIFEPKGLIEEGLPFVYSDHFKARMEELKNSVDSFLKERFVPYIKRLKCKITDFSKFKSAYSNYANVLRDHGYEEYAQILENRIDEVEEELLVKQKYSTVIAEFEHDMNNLSNTNGLNYDECSSYLNKLENWGNYFAGIEDAPKTIFNEYLKEITIKEKELVQREEIIDKEVKALIDSSIESQSSNELKENLKIMEMTLKKGIGEENQNLLMDNFHRASEALQAVSKQTNDINKLKKFLQLPLNELGEYKIFAINEAKNKLDEILQKQDIWVEKYIVPIEKGVGEMSPVECTSWLSQTQKVPNYINGDFFKRYKEAAALVNNQLHKSRVEGVYAMFNKLTDQEKQEFLRKIHIIKENN